MPNEIYHRSEWGNPKPEGWGNIYFDADATNELYKRSDNYENSDGTDEILRDIPNKASIVLTPTAYDNGSINSPVPTDGDGDFNFTRASIATRVNEKGLIEEVASGIPRIDYTSGFGSWLLEPQSTNLFQRSEEFDNSYWIKNNLSVTANQLVSPNGSTNADKVILDSGTNDINGGLYREISTTASTQYAFSIFAKKGEYRYGTIGFGSNNSNGFHFDLEEGVILSEFNASAQYTNISKQMIDYGNGWYRLIVVTQDDVGSSRFLGIRPHNEIPTSSNNVYSSTGDGTSGIYVWGAQLEQKSFATSYIKTEGSTVTRSADVANNSGNADLFNDTEGVLYAEIAALADDLTNRNISISDSSNDNEVRVTYRNLSNQLNFHIRANDVSVIFRNFTVSDTTEFAKVAFKYKSGESSVFVNGTEVLSINPTFTFSNTLNQLGFEDGSSFNDFYGKTKELSVFKEALTDAELESLTSWVSFTQMANDLEYTLE